MNEGKGHEHRPTTWSDEGIVCYIGDGHGWTSVMLNSHLTHICLGEEDKVKAILAGERPITDSGSLLRQRAFQRIFEITGGNEGAGTKKAGGRSPFRGRPIGTIRHRQKDSG